MKVVLDTNVFISGVFFDGPPFEILQSWRDRRIRIVVSAEILEEYRRVGQRLSEKYPGVDLEPFLALLAVEAEVVMAPAQKEPICADPEDDKFIACAIASGCQLIVSGDKHLRAVSGYHGIEVKTPRRFVDEYLRR